MEEKKEIKISLGTLICIIIIIILIIALGCMYYFGIYKNKNTNQIQSSANTTQNETDNNVAILLTADEYNEKYKNQTSNNTNTVNNSKALRILEKADNMFCIDSLEKNGDEYIITAYTLEKEPRVVSETEYQDLKNGKTINFRNQKWVLKDGDNHCGILQSGDNSLLLVYESKKIVNIAGAEAELSDFSDNLITFKVSKNILIGGQLYADLHYDDNGVLKAYNFQDEEITDFKSITFDKLLEICKTKTGSYQELYAFISNGKVDGIQYLED